MKDHLKIGCIVMAAGNAKRFGSNKLAMELRGQSLFHRALEAIPANQFETVVVVTQYQEFINRAKDFGFTVILNDQPDLGQSHTLQLGLSALLDLDGVLFQVADQPLLQRKSVEALLALWRKDPTRIAALGHQGRRGNPCLFPTRYFPELMEISGDRGGSAVIRNHPDDLKLLEVSEEELFDVDTAQALDQLKMM